MAAVLNPTTMRQVLDECCRSTEQQQRIAYRELYRPVLWPATFEEAMARQSFRTAICGVARNRMRIALRDVAKTPSTLPQGQPVPATPGLAPNAMAASNRSPYSKATGQPTAVTVWTTQRGVDLKRAANTKDQTA
jgi:hypothetical protein